MAYIIDNLKTLAKKEIAEGQRLARVLAKKGFIEKKASDSVGVVVPALTLNSIQVFLNDTRGQEYLKGCLESLQDGLIRKRVGAGALSLFDSEIDIAAMLAASESAGRFSKETIAAWFNEDLAPLLIAAAIGKGIAQAIAEKFAADYLAQFQVLASRPGKGCKIPMSAQVQEQLRKALALLPEGYESTTCEIVCSKLENDVEDPKTATVGFL